MPTSPEDDSLATFTTACPRNCYSTCGMRVTVDQGRVTVPGAGLLPDDLSLLPVEDDFGQLELLSTLGVLLPEAAQTEHQCFGGGGVVASAVFLPDEPALDVLQQLFLAAEELPVLLLLDH